MFIKKETLYFIILFWLNFNKITTLSFYDVINVNPSFVPKFQLKSPKVRFQDFKIVQNAKKLENIEDIIYYSNRIKKPTQNSTVESISNIPIYFNNRNSDDVVSIKRVTNPKTTIEKMFEKTSNSSATNLESTNKNGKKKRRRRRKRKPNFRSNQTKPIIRRLKRRERRQIDTTQLPINLMEKDDRINFISNHNQLTNKYLYPETVFTEKSSTTEFHSTTQKTPFINENFRINSSSDYSDEEFFSYLEEYMSNEDDEYSNEEIAVAKQNSTFSSDHNDSNSADPDHLSFFDYLMEILMPTDFDGSSKEDNSSQEENIDYSSELLKKEPKNSIEKPTGFLTWILSWLGFETDINNKLSSTNENSHSSNWFSSWFNTEEETSEWYPNWWNVNGRSTKATTVPIAHITPTKPYLLADNQYLINLLAQQIVNSSTIKPNNSQQMEETSNKVSYNEYQIWRLNIKDMTRFKFLEGYKTNDKESQILWLAGPSLRGLNDILLSPDKLQSFENILKEKDLKHEVLIFDVGKALTYNTAKLTQNTSNRQNIQFNHRKYYKYDDIIRILEFYQKKYPEFIELIDIGRSYEGRILTLIRIAIKKKKKTLKIKTKSKKKNPLRNGVFIYAGSHGREWIGPATATYILRKIIKIFTSNDTSPIVDEVKNKIWYIIPVANPDGYEYSHEIDRMWSKTRSKHYNNEFSVLNLFHFTNNKNNICYGVDLNRNWNFNWNGEGSSNQPCNQFYSGTEAFSEPETKSYSKFLMDNRKFIKIFFSLEAYGHIITYPKNKNLTFAIQFADELSNVAEVGLKGLKKFNFRTRYRIDTDGDILPPKSGSAEYFAMFEAGIPYSYTIKLGDNGVHGFLLPSSLIEQTAKEAFEIITSMVNYI